MASLSPAIKAQKTTLPHEPVIQGLDHVPVAVNDLDAAAERYRQLGFVLKPGRPHDNGIRNQHIKFEDGTELELITAPEAVDPITTEYREHLEHGDGPAFLVLFAPETDSLENLLTAAGMEHQRHRRIVTFPQGDALRYIFFSRRNHSPTDRPEHFKHPNGTESLIGVWLSGDDFAQERELLLMLGATIDMEEVSIPEVLRAEVARFGDAEVVFLPAARQLATGRRIVGVTFRCRSVDAVRKALEAEIEKQALLVGHSLFLPPDATHGLWIEFRELF